MISTPSPPSQKEPPPSKTKDSGDKLIVPVNGFDHSPLAQKLPALALMVNSPVQSDEVSSVASFAFQLKSPASAGDISQS